MKTPKRRLAITFLLGVLLAFSPAGSIARVAPLAPDFKLRNLNGDSMQLSKLRGHIVVLDFWGSWCPPCIAQVPSMRRLAEKYKRHGVIVLNINVLDDPAAVRKFIAEHGQFGSEVLLTASDETVVKAFGIEQFPSALVIDRQGRVVARVSGGGIDDVPKIDTYLSHHTGSARSLDKD
jgi:thiol-disulfide isomerase/thioredoxin